MGVSAVVRWQRMNRRRARYEGMSGSPVARSKNTSMVSPVLTDTMEKWASRSGGTVSSGRTRPWGPTRSSGAPAVEARRGRGCRENSSAAAVMALTRCCRLWTQPRRFQAATARPSAARKTMATAPPINVGSRAEKAKLRRGRRGSPAMTMRRRSGRVRDSSRRARASSSGSLFDRGEVGKGGVILLWLAPHPAGPPEHAAGLDPHALGVDVPFDPAAGHDVEVAGGGDVAGHRARHHHVAAAHVALDGAALTDDHRGGRLDRAHHGAIDPEGALGLEVALDVSRAAEQILDLVARRRCGDVFFRTPCHWCPS